MHALRWTSAGIKNVRDQQDYIVAEIHELEELLAATPEENVIDRASLESRLQHANELLNSLPETAIGKKARLTFRGRPVFESYGVSAAFGTKAAGAFSDAFAVVAAALGDDLADMGPIPDRSRHELVITGTAIGSFGFEFELHEESSPLFQETTRSEKAMQNIERLMRLSAEGDDDEMTELIDEIHPRAVKKVYEFLDILVQQHAWCGLEFAGSSFRFADYEQLKASATRLKEENIQEWNERFEGELQGVLPAGRTFEFRLHEEDELIRGKIDVGIDDPDILNREWLHKPATITLAVIQVGQGRPRYSLLSLDDLHA